MPLVQTRRFGPLECADSSILTFAAGLPGFENQTRFALVEQPSLTPIVFLQSLEREELCFVAAPVEALLANYDLAVTSDDLERLALTTSRQPSPGREVLCLALLCAVGNDLAASNDPAAKNGPVTANLLAPLVVNLETRAAVQAVRADTRYSHRHVLGAEPDLLTESNEDPGCL
jgi:flagellar assembly factor FliW